MDGADDARHARACRPQRPEHGVLAAMRVHDVDLVLDQKAPDERRDLEAIVAPLVDDGGLDAQTAQLAGEPAVVEQHRRQHHIRLGDQEGRRRCDLDFGAGPQVGRHDMADAHRQRRARPRVASVVGRPQKIWRHRSTICKGSDTL